MSNISYDLNGNIQHLERTGNGYNVDNLNYNYKHGASNQLAYIDEIDIGTPTGIGDIQGQNPNNYTYSEIGELISDNSENITILYSNTGKVTAVKDKTTGQLKAKYYYDETDIRIKKEGYDNNGNLVKTTYYACLPEACLSYLW